MLSSRKFLRLKIMLAGGPHPALQLDRMGREIGETAVRRVGRIKENPFHLLLLLFACEVRDTRRNQLQFLWPDWTIPDCCFDVHYYVYHLHELYLVYN